MGIANLILYVHREKISTACKYLVHQIAVELATREEVFDEDGEFDKTIKEKFSLLGAMEEDFSGVKIEIDRNGNNQEIEMSEKFLKYKKEILEYLK